MVTAPRKSPYVGLMPFSEQDANFFFGRRSEIEIVSANLRASAMTLVYGPSGAGKSSLLRAGVLTFLSEQSKLNMRTRGTPEFVVAYFNDWTGNALSGLSESIHAAIMKAERIRALERVPAPSFVKMLENLFERFGLKLLIILDQFEECFQYHDKEDVEEFFAGELAAVLKCCDLPVHFLISMRDDMLYKLDCFKRQVPNLLDNRLVVRHLDVAAAHEAVTGPVSAYNNLLAPGRKPFEIEPLLVEEVLAQVKNVDRLGRAAMLDKKDESYVETTYLQLVMTRIWNEEVGGGSHKLRLETFTKLGGAKRIIETHLDSVMKMLSTAERNVAAACFKYLATPMGLKMAFTVPTLSKWTKLSETQIAPVLDTLVHVGPKKKRGARPPATPNGESPAADETRILRPVEIRAGDSVQSGYEASHDALIVPMSDWRSKWEERTSRRRWVIRVVICALAVWLIAFGASLYNFNLSVQRKTKDLQNQVREIEDEVDALETEQGRNARFNSTLVEIMDGLRSKKRDEHDKAAKRLRDWLNEESIPENLQPIILQLASNISPAEVESVRLSIEQGKSGDQARYANLQPRVYIHIQDVEQRKGAERIRERLQSSGFVVPGIQNVGQRNLGRTDVRFFKNNEEESGLSQRVKQVLQQLGVADVAVRFIPGYEDSKNMRPRHLEIWLAAGAFK